jgi:tRNA1(Val) A37 N6-methylase TrmN6
LSNIFSAISPDEKFDVITANLPFMKKRARNILESSIWDTDLNANKSFFRSVRDFMVPNGRAYITQADFGAIKEVLDLGKKQGFCIKQIGKKSIVGYGTFYAFELKVAAVN